MNTKLLRKVQEHILAEPLRFSFQWFLKTETSPCGTKACIGGWTVILGKKYNPKKMTHAKAGGSDEARKLLKITEPQADRLFFYWPYGFDHDAKGAAKRIDLFIRTKGRE